MCVASVSFPPPPPPSTPNRKRRYLERLVSKPHFLPQLYPPKCHLPLRTARSAPLQPTLLPSSPVPSHLGKLTPCTTNLAKSCGRGRREPPRPLLAESPATRTARTPNSPSPRFSVSGASPSTVANRCCFESFSVGVNHRESRSPLTTQTPRLPGTIHPHNYNVSLSSRIYPSYNLHVIHGPLCSILPDLSSWLNISLELITKVYTRSSYHLDT